MSNILFEIPFDLRIKSLCKKCKHLEECFAKDRSKVLEDIYFFEPCDDICGCCTLCCNRFDLKYKQPDFATNHDEEILAEDNLPF